MDKKAIELIQESNDRKLNFVETLYIVKQPRVVGVVVWFMITIMVSCINAIIRMYRNDDIRMYKFHYLSDTICMR